MSEPPGEPSVGQSSGGTQRSSNAAKIAKKYRKKARRLERELHAEMVKNVELYNRKNKAAVALKRLTQENADILDVLRLSLNEPSVPLAKEVALSKEQEELFWLTSL